MPFKSGQSGNSTGRPKGIPDKRTLLRQHLDPHAPELIAKAVEMALDGDSAMLKLCIDKLIGNCRPREKAVQIAEFTGSLSYKGNRVLDAIADGQISPTEGSAILSAIANQAKLVELDELISRIEALEGEYKTTHTAA